MEIKSLDKIAKDLEIVTSEVQTQINLKASLASPALTGTPKLNGMVLSVGKGMRQTVQSGSVDTNGYANFLGTSASLVMPISATTTPLAISASGGSLDNDRWGKVVANTTLAFSALATSYIIATISVAGAITFSSVTLAPIYQFGGTPSVTNNQYTFNIGEMKMYLGNGSNVNQVWAVCVGEAVTSGTAIISVVIYALNGMYDSGWTATLPSPSTDISRNSNLGVRAFNYRVIIEVTTAEHGFSIGDTVEVMAHDGTSASVLPITVTPKTISFFTAATNGLRMMSKTTKGYVAPTLANYKYKLIAQRGW